MDRLRNSTRFASGLGAMLLAAVSVSAETPSPALLVLEKSDNTLAIVDPATLLIVARVAAGEDPHEVTASDDGRVAYISNYGGEGSTLNTISVVDLIARKALPAVDLGALHSPHGLAMAGGKLYFTAETNKVIGRYDPATRRVDWVLGTGEDRTHMLVVAPSLERIVTSNVSSGTVSIIERIMQPSGPLGPPPGSNGPPGTAAPGLPGPGGEPRQSWIVTNVVAGQGSEGIDVSPDGREIWVANARDGTATIIEAADKRVSQTVPISVKGANRLKFTPDGKRVLITGLGGRGGSSAAAAADLSVLDASTRKEVKQISAGNRPDGLAWAVRN